MNESVAGAHTGRQNWWAWLAFVWGFAEATLFFIVPDVLITRIALRDLRRALITALCALGGAMIGGTSVWFAARQGAAPQLLDIFAHLPGINRDVIALTGSAIHERGVTSLFAGGVTFQPYKLFAVHAGSQGVPFGLFFIASVAARLGRFVLTATAAWLIGRALPPRTVSYCHAIFWTVLYLTYFIAMR